MWKRYVQLTEAEWAFRITKDELEIRPIRHQKQDRVKAHILVCFLAYALWKTLAQWMRGAGSGDAPRTLVEEFARIKSGDVVLKAKHADGRGHSIRVRCVTTPDKAQKVCSIAWVRRSRSGCGPSMRSDKCSHDFLLESPLTTPPGAI
ncbi:MAG: hypothetical protein AABZ12_12450 [Planctomycetota bacterium]